MMRGRQSERIFSRLDTKDEQRKICLMRLRCVVSNAWSIFDTIQSACIGRS